ncbi:MAG: hypothetical protein KC561_04490, partial [Myxococcales bacterium]|nr:hypothetical protein [Myxococcales bacterium]
DRAQLLEKRAFHLEAAGAYEQLLNALNDILYIRGDDIALLERAADAALQLEDAESEAKFVRRLVRAPEIDDDESLSARIRLARIYSEQLSDSAKAVTELKAILAKHPGHPGAISLLEDVLLSEDRAIELRRILQQQSDAAPADARRDILLRLADLAGDDGSGRDSKADALEKILAADPEDNEIAGQLARHYEDKGQWRKATKALQHLFDHSEAREQKIEILRRLGAILEHQLQDDSAAKTAYSSILELEPREVGAYRAMLRISQKTGEFAAIPSLTEQIVSLDPSASDLNDLVHGAADVAADQLEDDDSAVELLKRLTELDPFDASALSKLTVLLERKELWNDLEDALDRLSGLTEEDNRRIELWSKRAKVLEEHLERLDEAAACYRDILQLHSGNRLALHSLKRVQSRLERWTDVLLVLQRLSQVESDPVIRAAALREAADVHLERLRQPEEAFALHRQVHELLVDEESSLQAMRRIAEEHDLWPNYVDVILSELERAPDAEKQLELTLESAATIEERLGDADTSYELLNARFQSTPQNDRLFDELIALTVRHSFWDRLESSYKRRIQATLEPADQTELYHALADRLLMSEEAERALYVYGEAHANQPTNPTSLERMDEVAGAHELWDKYEVLLNARWEAAEDTAEKVALSLRRADILANHLSRAEYALDALVLAFQLAPLDASVEAALFALADDGDLWPAIEKLYGFVAKGAEDPGVERHLYSRLAEIASDKLSNPERAFDYSARAWRTSPYDSALREDMEARATAAGKEDALADAFRWAAEHAGSQEAQLVGYLEQADVFLNKLENLEGGVGALTAAFEVPVERETTLAMLRSSLESKNEHTLLLTTLTQWAAIPEKKSEKALVFRAIAEVAEAMGLLPEAVEAYRGVLAWIPGDAEALRRLASLHANAGDIERQIRTLEQLVEVVDDSDERHRLLKGIAELQIEIGKPNGAIQTLERSITLFPERVPPLAKLIDLYLSIDAHESVVQLVERMSERRIEKLDSDAIIRGARVALDELEDEERAQRIGQRLLQQDPNDRGGLRLLAEMALRGERWQAYADALLRLGKLPAEDAAEHEAEDAYNRIVSGEWDKRLRGYASLDAPNAPAAYLALAAVIQEYKLIYAKRARDTWREAAKAAPDWPIPLLEVARLSGEFSDTAEAQRAYREAIARLGAFENVRRLASQAWQGLAAEQAHAGVDSEEILQSLEAAIAANPVNTAARGQYLELVQHVDTLERAEAHFRQLVIQEKVPTFRQAALVGHARMLEALNRHAQAAISWNEAFELEDGDDPAVNLAIAELAQRRGRTDRAVELLRRLMNVANENPAAMPADETMGSLHKRLASAAEADGDLSLAQDHYARAQAADPSDLEASLGLARISIERGASALAKTYVEEVLAQAEQGSGPHQEALLLRVDMLLAEDKRTEANALLKTIRGGSMTQTALDRLAELQTNQRMWEQAIESLQSLESRQSPGPQRSRTRVKLGSLLRDHKRDMENAWAALSGAVEDDDGNLDAVHEALKLSVRVNRFD